MSIEKCTPGEWTVGEHPHSGHALVVGGMGVVVADCGNSEIAPEAEDANAHMLAASKLMHAALKAFVEYMQNDDPFDRDHVVEMAACMEGALAALSASESQR